MTRLSQRVVENVHRPTPDGVVSCSDYYEACSTLKMLSLFRERYKPRFHNRTYLICYNVTKMRRFLAWKRSPVIPVSILPRHCKSLANQPVKRQAPPRK